MPATAPRETGSGSEQPEQPGLAASSLNAVATRSRLALPAALSLVVHAALVALAAAAHVGFASSSRVTPEPPIALELVEIEYLAAPAPDEPAVAPAVPDLGERALAPRPPVLDRAPDPGEDAPRITATAPAGSEPAPASEPAPPDQSPGTLSMRDPSRDPTRAPTRPGESSGPARPPSWMLSAGQIALRDVPLEPPPPAPPPRAPLAPIQPRKPPRVDSELRPDSGGTHRADDTTFTARIARDGRVKFDDKPNFQAHIALPSLRQLARGLEAWADDPYGFATAGAHPESIHRAPDPDPDKPSPEPDDERSKEKYEEQPGVIFPIVGGSFDITDAVMRALGQDPYAARKANFLDRTLDERVQISATARREDLREATRAVSVQLLAIWRYEAWSATKRREALFALWDECAEEGARDVVEAADQVRAEIERFIRQQLPAGSPKAYTEDELARLNARRTSGRVFAPYLDRRP